MDIWVTQAINNLAGTNLIADQVMVLLTSYGIFAMILLVVLMWWSQSDRLGSRNACLVAGAAFLLSLGFNQLILLFLHRVRPYDVGVSHLLIAPNPDWSFPSDHATAASAIVFGLWFKGQKRATLFLAILAAGICFSRVYVGVHYVSDILGGAFIGAIVAFVLSRIYKDDAWYAKYAAKVL